MAALPWGKMAIGHQLGQVTQFADPHWSGIILRVSRTMNVAEVLFRVETTRLMTVFGHERLEMENGFHLERRARIPLVGLGGRGGCSHLIGWKVQTEASYWLWSRQKEGGQAQTF